MFLLNKKDKGKGQHQQDHNLFNQTSFLTNKHSNNRFTLRLRPRTVFQTKRSQNNLKDHKQAQTIEKDFKQQRETPKEIDEIKGLEQFDKMRLQDFLKFVIVGNNNLRETKSKQIIRSLNGTWFRNTNKGQSKNSSRFFCSLPIKRQKASSLGKKNDLELKSYISEYFHNQYNPPNTFPKRNCLPKRSFSSQLKPNSDELSVFSPQPQEAKGQLIKKIQSIKQSKITRRASARLSKQKGVKFFDGQSGCLLGKKMNMQE